MSTMSKALKQALKTANGHYREESYEEAEKVLKEVDDDDKQYMYWVMLGACLHKQNKRKGAEESYKKAVALDAGDIQAWKGLRDVYRETTDVKHSVEALGRVAALETNPDAASAALNRIAELVADYDAVKLESATFVRDVGTELEARPTPLVVAATNRHADKVWQRLLACDAVARSLVYSIHPAADAAVAHVLGNVEKEVYAEDRPLPDEKKAGLVDWTLRRGLNGSADSVDLTGLAKTAVTALTHRETVPSYWVLKIATALQDLDVEDFDEGSFPENLGEELNSACHRVCPQDIPVTEDKSSRRRNKSKEEVELETKQRVAGATLAAGRIAAVVGCTTPLERETLLSVHHAHAAGEWVHLPDAADLEAPLVWLQVTATACPEAVAPHCLRANTLFRLGRFTEAAASASAGLAALAYREAAKSLTGSAVLRWASRLTSVLSLADFALGLHKTAGDVVRRAGRAYGAAELGQRVVMAEVLREQDPEKSLKLLRGKVCEHCGEYEGTPESVRAHKGQCASNPNARQKRAENDEAPAMVVCEYCGVFAGAPALVQAHKGHCSHNENSRRNKAAGVLHAEAKTLLNLRQYDEALRRLEEALAKVKYDAEAPAVPPQSPVPHILSTRAEVQWQNGCGEEAAATAARAVELRPTLARPYCILGHQLYSQQTRHDLRDGVLRSKGDFAQRDGHTRNWVASGAAVRRVDAADGNAYTLEQFEAEYGRRSAQWATARPYAVAPTEQDLQAMAQYRLCLTYAPLDAEAGRALCSLCSVFGLHAELHEAVSRISAAADAAGSIAAYLWAFKLQGFESLKHARYEDACRCLKHCVRYSGGAVVTYGLARAYEGLDNSARALQLYKAIVGGTKEGDDAAAPDLLVAAKHGMAACLVQTKAPEKAEALLLEITAQNPDAEASWCLLAKCRWSRALETSSSAAAAAAGSGERDAAAVVFLEKAVAAADEALRCSKGSANACRLKGDVCLSGAALHAKAARPALLQQALAAFEAALAAAKLGRGRTTAAELGHSHYDVARARFALFVEDGEDAQRAAAEAACREAIKKLPRCPAFWTLLGCATPSNLPNRRLYCINKALELDPQNFTAWCNQGWLLLMHGQPSTAKAAFERAQGISPEAYQPWIGKGLALMRMSFGSMTYDAKNCLEQAYLVEPCKRTALMSLVAQHFYQPRKYGGLAAELGPRARYVREAFAEEATALNTAGLVLEELGELEEAYAAFQECEQQLPTDDRARVLQWVSGRNGVVPVREGEDAEWSLCDAYSMYRMVLTSKLRVLCKQRQGEGALARAVERDLTELVSDEDMPHFESTARAVLCHWLSVGCNDKAEALVAAVLGETEDTASHDAVLAALAMHRSRLVDDASAAKFFPAFGVDRITDPDVQRVAAMVEASGAALRSPCEEPDLTMAQTVREKLLLFKVLFESGEGPASIRYRDPSDNALIEFRHLPNGEVVYAVNGEQRPPFKQAEIGQDDDGAYVEMPDIDTCVGLPSGEQRGEVLPRLLRLFALAGVTCNLSAQPSAGARPAAGDKQTALAVAQLLGLVRIVSAGRDRAAHNNLGDTIEVLYRFALVLAAMPDKLPPATQDLPRLLVRCVTLLKRITEGATMQDDIMLFKARYALALILYASPCLFSGASQPWEDVVQPAGDGGDDADDDGSGGGGGEGGNASEEASQFPALQWCTNIIADIADEGYAEASTLLGLAKYAEGKYEEAIRLLTETLEKGLSGKLDWRRWDVHLGVVYSMVMLGRFDDADAFLARDETVAGAQARQVEAARQFVAHRRLLAQGAVDDALEAAEASVAASAEPSSLLPAAMDLVSFAVGTESFAPVKDRLRGALPDSLLRRNILASLCCLEGWGHLKKDNEGLPLMAAKLPPQSLHLVEKAEGEWPGCFVAKVMRVLCGLLAHDPEMSSTALDGLRAELGTGIDSTPLLYYWLSFVREGQTPWDGLHSLLREVGNANVPDHLWFALRKVVEAVVRDWAALCPQVKQPDAAKLKGKEYREAMAQVEPRKLQRIEQVQRAKRIAAACLDKLADLRPGSPYVGQSRAQVDRLA